MLATEWVNITFRCLTALYRLSSFTNCIMTPRQKFTPRPKCLIPKTKSYENKGGRGAQLIIPLWWFLGLGRGGGDLGLAFADHRSPHGCLHLPPPRSIPPSAGRTSCALPRRGMQVIAAGAAQIPGVCTFFVQSQSPRELKIL